MTYGEIEQCTIKMNPVTNKSRCFGFITFATKEALEAAIAVSPHTVKGKQIDPKPAKARPGANKVMNSNDDIWNVLLYYITL